MLRTNIFPQFNGCASFVTRLLTRVDAGSTSKATKAYMNRA